MPGMIMHEQKIEWAPKRKVLEYDKKADGEIICKIGGENQVQGNLLVSRFGERQQLSDVRNRGNSRECPTAQSSLSIEINIIFCFVSVFSTSLVT